jgi:hypothetical protein
MSDGHPDLSMLLLDLSDLTVEEADSEGEDLFRTEFITRNGRSGSVATHDGQTVIFFADRYHHAFHTSYNRARHTYSKAKVAIDRIERLPWIRPILEGHIPKTECWEVPLDTPRPFPGKRLYVSWEHSYVIWLEPLTAGGFRFSTAYPVTNAEIGRYTKCARKIWTYCG